MFAKGVLPDTVIRDPRAEGVVVLATLDPALDPAGVRAWLTQVEALIRRLIAPLNGVPVARVAVALGRSFFFAGEAARFGLDERAPLGLREPPAFEAEDRLPDSDVLFYLMTTSEAVAVEFLDGLSQTRPLGLRRLEVERGFQRTDAREMFGFLDGLRNVPFHERFRTVFVNREVTADEPAWTEDGTYLAYMKIEQDLDLWRSISLEEQEQIIGRRKSDGSRLDLPPATKARSEPDFGSGVPSPGSHVRKVGPRGEHADLKIFRRGVPYFSVRPDGTPDAGLHFVSFQASLDQFDTIMNRWMTNPDFPPGFGQVDALFAHDPPLVRVRRAGFFFVPPAAPIDRHVGAQIFDAPLPEHGRRADFGRLFVRKKVLNPDASPARADLRNIRFEVTRVDDGAVVGTLVTDSAGHALSEDLPRDTDLLLREVFAPPTFQPPEPLQFRLEHRREVRTVTNFLRQPGPYGQG